MIMKDDDRTKSSTRNEGKSKGEDENGKNDAHCQHYQLQA